LAVLIKKSVVRHGAGHGHHAHGTDQLANAEKTSGFGTHDETTVTSWTQNKVSNLTGWGPEPIVVFRGSYGVNTTPKISGVLWEATETSHLVIGVPINSRWIIIRYFPFWMFSEKKVPY